VSGELWLKYLKVHSGCFQEKKHYYFKCVQDGSKWISRLWTLTYPLISIIFIHIFAFIPMIEHLERHLASNNQIGSFSAVENFNIYCEAWFAIQSAHQFSIDTKILYVFLLPESCRPIIFYLFQSFFFGYFLSFILNQKTNNMKMNKMKFWIKIKNKKCKNSRDQYFKNHLPSRVFLLKNHLKPIA